MCPSNTGSSSSSCIDSKKGCSSAYSTVIRLSGFKSSILSSKSRASAGKVGKSSCKGTFSFTGSDSIYFKAYSFDMCFFVAVSGVPLTLMMRFTCSIQCQPGNKIRPEIISAKVQPADHMSTALVYSCDESIISGARQNRVTTYSVKSSPFSLLRFRLSPKSLSENQKGSSLPYLQIAVFIKENITRLEIAMYDPC